MLNSHFIQFFKLFNNLADDAIENSHTTKMMREMVDNFDIIDAVCEKKGCKQSKYQSVGVKRSQTDSECSFKINHISTDDSEYTIENIDHNLGNMKSYIQSHISRNLTIDFPSQADLLKNQDLILPPTINKVPFSLKR